MVAVTADEVRPGLVIHIQPEVIRALGGCWVKIEPGKETMADHYFLVVESYADKAECLATPLFSKKNDIRDRVLLDEDLKSGKPEHWKGITSYFFKWQFWRIPLSSIQAASSRDDSTPTDRRFFGADNPTAVAAVAKDIKRLRQPWREWNSK